MSPIPNYLSSVPVVQGTPLASGSGSYNPYFASSNTSVPAAPPLFAPSNGILHTNILNMNKNETYTHSDFAAFNVEQKTQVLHHIVNEQLLLADLRHLTRFHINIDTCNHDRSFKTKAQLIAAFHEHCCSATCLIRCVDAESAHFRDFESLSPATFQICSNALRLRNSATPKRKNVGDTFLPSKKARYEVPERNATESVSTEWPILLPTSEKLAILQESFEAGNNSSIKSVECSFCGIMSHTDECSCIPCDTLDISLLTAAVDELRVRSRQTVIEAYQPSTIIGKCYQVCTFCQREIRNVKQDDNGMESHDNDYSKEFVRLPLRSYANGTWIGDVPDALKDLTFLEEQCIARARATRCMFKLDLGPSGQCASRGNVCVFPQDPGPLVNCLPPPLSQIQDEICVILVGSPNTKITIDMLAKTPLLVRRNKIVGALRWLKVNNPMYSDLDINTIERNAADYPEHGIPIPIQAIIRTESTSEGVSYTEQGGQESNNVSTTGMPSSTVVDSDNVESTYKMCKLAAVNCLKNGAEPFMKFASGSTPLSTRKNPTLYAHLWPTLFPYGVGMLESSVDRCNDSVEFCSMDITKHISYLLSSAPNQRFQTHLSFIFVMGNILQRRQTSYSAKLAVKRSWFPRVDTLLGKVSADTISQYTEKLENNPFARPDNEGEKAANELIRYVNYIGEHIPGSMAEVQNLRDELFSIVHTNGLPHIFLTLNPSDTNNPIAQVLAGRDIDLDKFFHELSPGCENLDRSRYVAQNPIAGAHFFDRSVQNLVDILLGTRRHNRQGVFGEVSVYYGVVEAQGRGSLHIHLMLWLHNGLSPKEIQDCRLESPEWEKKLIAWYDDVFSQSIPPDTSEYVPADHIYKRYPVMCRPHNPSVADYWTHFNQDLRDILDNAGMIHEHNAICFKHLPVKLRALRNDDQDCRFQLPRDTVDETHFDNDGYLLLRSNNGYVNGHNPLITVAHRCNSDAKPIGGGTVAMAMFQYFGNYTAKHSMDTSFVFSALCSAIKVLSEDPPMNIDGNIDTHERSRLLLVKTVNKLIGKRELSGQQIASRL